MPPRYQDLDWYSAPRYYDLVFSALDERELDFLEAIYTEYGPGRRRRVLEPACGSGRLMLGLAERGFQVSGFDLSPDMARFSKERLAKAGYKPAVKVADMSDFTVRGRYEMAHCLVSSFKYLLTERAAVGHLRSVARALVAGGIYVLGFHLSDYDDETLDRERWVGKRRGLEVVCNITSWPPDRRKRRENIRSRLVVTERGKTSRFQTLWQFRTYDERQALALFAKVPELELIATYDMTYDLDRLQDFGTEQFDQVAILRKR
ncbi:MAG: class I SAM-dependent methyltransferase [Deltaproteobacteria bacterium]|nr:class I SAM-dependent methyltransferase [Deltaproteobacteria bacterium]